MAGSTQIEPPVAVVLVNYRDYAERYLADCLQSLAAQDYGGGLWMVIVDNASTQVTHDYLRVAAPEATIVRNQDNDGYAKGCNDGIRAAVASGLEWIFVLNMDTVLDPAAVRELMAVARADAATGGRAPVGAVQARLHLWTEKDTINTLGNATHFLGFGFCTGYREVWDPESADTAAVPDIFYPSGAAVLLCASALESVGLFDEEIWMYNEDQDLGWRMWLGGHRCVLAARSLVYHRYEFERSVGKYYWMDRNRLIALAKNYHVLTLLLIAPALLVMEFGLLSFAARTGWLRGKLRVLCYFLRPRTWSYLWRERRRIQARREIRDRDLTPLIAGAISYPEIDSLLLRLVNPLFAAYWWCCRRLIRW